jgi:hypothetical protein
MTMSKSPAPSAPDTPTAPRSQAFGSRVWGLVGFGKPSEVVPLKMTVQDPVSGKPRTVSRMGFVGELVRRIVESVKAANELMKNPPQPETFENAVRRLKLTEEIIAQRRSEKLYAGRLEIVLAIAVMFFSISQLLPPANLSTQLSTLWSVGLGVLFSLAVLFRGLASTYRAWQIRERALHPFSVFLKRPEAWWG